DAPPNLSALAEISRRAHARGRARPRDPDGHARISPPLLGEGEPPHDPPGPALHALLRDGRALAPREGRARRAAAEGAAPDRGAPAPRTWLVARPAPHEVRALREHALLPPQEARPRGNRAAAE